MCRTQLSKHRGCDKRDDLVSDQITSWTYLHRERHRDGLAVHCVSGLQERICCAAGRKGGKTEGEEEEALVLSGPV
jgi:hypothetical protein